MKWLRKLRVGQEAYCEVRQFFLQKHGDGTAKAPILFGTTQRADGRYCVVKMQVVEGERVIEIVHNPEEGMSEPAAESFAATLTEAEALITPVLPATDEDEEDETETPTNKGSEDEWDSQFPAA